MGINRFFDAPYADVSRASSQRIGAAVIVKALLPIMNPEVSIVGMDFDPSRAMPATTG